MRSRDPRGGGIARGHIINSAKHVAPLPDMRTSQAEVSPSAASTSATGGQMAMAGASRSLRPCSAMSRALPRAWRRGPPCPTP
jgi:hypothetical protein